MMDKWPQPFWAVLLAGLGCELAIAVLFHTSTQENIALGVLTVASNLVSGALGAFAGAAHAAKSQTAPVTVN